MATRLSSSRVYRHLWGTPETDALFDEPAMLQRWLDILVALARAQEELGIVPAGSAATIAAHARVEALDLDVIAAETRRTAHSTLGLIRGLQAVLPEEVREHVYVGATVQDLSDTWFGTVMRDVGALVWRDLRAIEARLLELAREHRGTVMAGRTHGQPGAPITFGFKVASWADEVRRLARERDAVILAHNHPSGNPEPSRADEHLTQHVRNALALVDVRLLDHIIVAGRQTLSLAERGLL